MRAILKFKDGRRKISAVHSSEDAIGNVYILSVYCEKDELGREIWFKFERLSHRNGGPVATYSELDSSPVACSA